MTRARGRSLITFTLAAAAALAAGADRAEAANITYQILDLTPQGGADTGATFNGTGFAGMHDGSFSNFFMYETFADGTVWSRTSLQVDISALAGATITGATLSYVLLNGLPGVGELELTSWDSDGTISYTFPNPPNVISTTTYFPVGLSPNSLDVTAQLAERVGAGDSWFGLFFGMAATGEDELQWTDTFSDPDAALVRLSVEYTTAAVPEPSSLALLGTAGLLGACGLARRIRRA